MKRFRWLLLITVLVLVLGIGGYLAAGYAIYLQLSPVQAKCTGAFLHPDVPDNTPAHFLGNYGTIREIDVSDLQMPNYEDVEFPSRGDNVTIRGWFVPSEAESEDVIIVVHGIRSCRRNAEVMIPAGMLNHAGFNVLLIDLRNHGDSEVVDGRAAAGNLEYRDVLGAYDWLVEQGFRSENIGLVGVSLGAATSINAFGEEQGIAALWADSSFADIHDVLDAEMERNHYPTFFTNAGLFVTYLMGINLTEFSPIDSIAKNNNRPVYITHGTADARLSVDYAYQLYEQAGDNAELWIVEGADHLEAMITHEREYQEKLVNFFDKALRADE